MHRPVDYLRKIEYSYTIKLIINIIGNMMKHTLLLFAMVLVVHAGVIKQPESAIAARYPGAVFDKKRALLSDTETARIESLARQKLSSKLMTYYEIKEGKTTRYAVLQTLKVRSKTMTALTFVCEGKITHIEMIAFYEPGEYLPSPRWLATFEGKGAADAIQPKQDIPTITGATLSANAVARASRIALAFVNVKTGQP